jgi:hypothetical protein
MFGDILGFETATVETGDWTLTGLACRSTA